eukprot:6191426-Pleurochrysis_carterae.AAC.1
MHKYQRLVLSHSTSRGTLTRERAASPLLKAERALEVARRPRRVPNLSLKTPCRPCVRPSTPRAGVCPRFPYERAVGFRAVPFHPSLARFTLPDAFPRFQSLTHVSKHARTRTAPSPPPTIRSSRQYDYWYVEGQCGEDRCIDATYWAQTWGSYVLVLYLYIPTTLIVTLPFIQLFQCSFMSSDVDMYDETVDEPCAVGNATLCDELGQISHIFSDKTGTLTANHMEFRRCVIGGVAYGCGDTAISRTVRGAVAPPPLRPPPPAAQTMRKCSSSFVSFAEAADAPSLFELIARNDAAAAAAHEFFLAMAINHSVRARAVESRARRLLNLADPHLLLLSIAPCLSSSLPSLLLPLLAFCLAYCFTPH